MDIYNFQMNTTINNGTLNEELMKARGLTVFGSNCFLKDTFNKDCFYGEPEITIDFSNNYTKDSL